MPINFMGSLLMWWLHQSYSAMHQRCLLVAVFGQGQNPASQAVCGTQVTFINVVETVIY
jgi:hypothetical protein